MSIDNILAALNQHAHRYRFGTLQEIRKQRRPLKRRPSRLPFRSTERKWAHHLGGRDELQFNVAIDNGDLRWGVAISLQASRSMPQPADLHPKLRKLSRFIEDHAEHLRMRGFVMWHWTDDVDPERARSADRTPQPVSEDLYEDGTFIFLGKHDRVAAFDVDAVLHDFDALLPVYEFVEFDPEDADPVLNHQRTFEFHPRDPALFEEPTARTVAKRTPGDTDIALRHRALQHALAFSLHAAGAEVDIEVADGKGRSIDLVAGRDGRLEFYEVKTDHSARLCVRHAIGQLLEYAYWPEPIKPAKLVVVGEPQLDPSTATYLEILRTKSRLPICYRQESP